MNIAAIRIRGEVRKNPDIRTTLKYLKLFHKHNCTILEDTPQNLGMLRKVCGFITWGQISDELFKELCEKRGSETNKTHFRLSPPKGGYDCEGIRKYIKMRGACGDRKDKISELLKRMI